jgi:hypothetical protein
MNNDINMIAPQIEWGEKLDTVRALVLSSSRTNPNTQDLVRRPLLWLDG